MNCVYLGDQALLITLDADDPAPSAVAQALDRQQISGILDLVPALESVTVHMEPLALTPVAVLDYLRSASTAGATVQTHHHRLPIRYDGVDLESVATQCRLSIDEVIKIHSTAVYTVAFVGFLPGFPYLRGLPPALHLPRRPTPRTRVPAGAVAIANDQTGIYPQASPGGWHLIGTTTAQLFDPLQTPPTLLAAGDTIRFEPQ